MAVLIEVTADAVVAELQDFPARSGKAMVRALNRGIASARTFMARAIAGDTGLKQKDIRDALPMQEATLSRPVAQLAASLKRIPLIKFKARGPEPTRGRGRGVTYSLGSKGRGRQESAFIATMRSGHRGVYARVATSTRKSSGAWSKNLPITELKGPSLGHVFAKFRQPALARAQEAFEKNFAHELKFGRSQDASGSD